MSHRFLSLFCPDVPFNRLTRLVEWCDRYSPLAATDGNDGVILDITGCTHLFGGEGPFLLNLRQNLQRMGVKTRGAIADAWGVAWALAHYGQRFIVNGDDAAAALAPLPVEALRLPDEMVSELRRLGLTTIGAVMNIQREPLAARFGAALLRRLDQLFHNAEEPLKPWRPPAPYRAMRTLEEPVSTIEAVEYWLREMMQEVCARLEKNQVGSRQMDLACYRVDGTLDRREARTSKPTRSVPHLMRLFRDHLEKLRAGFGFENFVLSVLDAEALAPAQMAFSQSAPVGDESTFDALVDRLGMKLGFSEVNRVRIRESFLPERSVELCNAAAPAGESVCSTWPAYRIRPVRLIDPPMGIEVSVLIPGESPVQFFIGERRHRVVRSEGPERLLGEWWMNNNSRPDRRDYYRVEDDRGLRFWIFRNSSDRWFLHGHLP